MANISKTSSPSGVDRISYLPDNVIERILTHLPLCEAVCTSILSRSWRYKWSNLSVIVFDDFAIPLPEPFVQPEFEAKLVKAIDQVLLLHQGPIRQFVLSADLYNIKDIDRWVIFLSRNDLRSFTLSRWTDEKYKVPSCLFSCKNMSYLELYGCSVRLPEWFAGFKELTVLYLQEVTISSEHLENLIFTCANLKELTLESIYSCSRLRICAPELKKLWVVNATDDLRLENTPLLSNASITLDPYFGNVSVQSGEDCNLIKVLGYLPNLVKLNLFPPTLMALSRGDVPKKLPMTYQLEHLTIDISFVDIKEMACVLCLFRSSPFLKTVKIEAASDKTPDTMCEAYFWNAQDLDCSFDCLETMSIGKFTGIQSEMKFIEFVLANAPILESLHIDFEVHFERSEGDVKKILKELLNFSRISARAKIVFPTS